MILAPFNEVYEAYHRIIATRSQGPSSYDEFEWHPIKLIQAYALAATALQDRCVVRTPSWSRQTGASTFAYSLVVTSRDVYVLKADRRATKEATRCLLNAYLIEHMYKYVKGSPEAWHHDRVLNTATIHRELQGRELPKLIVVDSEIAYTKNREETIAWVASRGIPTLVLEGPTPPHFI